MKSKFNEALEKLVKLESEMNIIVKGLKSEFKGSKVRVISNFNDQVIGSSKKSLKGKIGVVRTIIFSHGRLSILLEKREVYMDHTEVEEV